MKWHNRSSDWVPDHCERARQVNKKSIWDLNRLTDKQKIKKYEKINDSKRNQKRNEKKKSRIVNKPFDLNGQSQWAVELSVCIWRSLVFDFVSSIATMCDIRLNNRHIYRTQRRIKSAGLLITHRVMAFLVRRNSKRNGDLSAMNDEHKLDAWCMGNAPADNAFAFADNPLNSSNK